MRIVLALLLVACLQAYGQRQQPYGESLQLDRHHLLLDALHAQWQTLSHWASAASVDTLPFGGIAIQHTGSCGESTTMLHSLQATWQ